MSLIIKNLSYIHPNREFLFQNISLSLELGEKASLIGNNGTGKSTLFKILMGELYPYQGEYIYSNIYYIPQHFGQYDHMTIAEALKVDDKIKALHNILNGNVSEENFSILNDEWDIEERVLSALQYWQMDSFLLTQPLYSLSGGEKTKIFLSGIYLHSPDIILMDEPTITWMSPVGINYISLFRQQKLLYLSLVMIGHYLVFYLLLMKFIKGRFLCMEGTMIFIYKRKKNN